MTSPLAERINSSIIITRGNNSATITDGRYTSEISSRILVQCYLKRIQGSTQDSSTGEASDQPRYEGYGIDMSRYMYRGYCLRYGIISDSFNLGDDESSLVLRDIRDLSFMDGVRDYGIQIRHGLQLLSNGVIQIIGGVYGSRGIDEIIYENIGGVPITIRGNSSGYIG